MLLANRSSAADSNNNKQKKHWTHEFLSIEIQVWPLTGPMSCLIDHSNAQASRKNGIGKLVVRSVLPPIPALISDRGEVFVAVVSDLEEAGRSSHLNTHTQRFAETCCLSCFLVPRFHRGSHTHLNHPRLPCIFVIYLSSVYVFIKQVDCFPGL